MQIIKRFLELEWPNTVSLNDALTRLAHHLYGYVIADRIYLVLRNPRTKLWHAFSSLEEVSAENLFSGLIDSELLSLAEKQPTGAVRTYVLDPKNPQFELSIPLWYAVPVFKAVSRSEALNLTVQGCWFGVDGDALLVNGGALSYAVYNATPGITHRL
jgi:hypothetical protein